MLLISEQRTAFLRVLRETTATSALKNRGSTTDSGFENYRTRNSSAVASSLVLTRG
jgi:hypothetical protein